MLQEYLERVGLFRSQVEKLRGNRRIFGGYQIGFGARFELNSNALGKMDPRDIKEVLLALRPFLLNNESVNFYSVCNLVFLNSSEIDLRRDINSARSAWRQVLGVSPNISLPLDNKPLTPEQNLDLWMNGELFHLETKKVVKLEKLKSGVGGSISFLMLLETLKGLYTIVDDFDRKVVSRILQTEKS